MYVDKRELVDLANQVNVAFKALQEEMTLLKAKMEALEAPSVATGVVPKVAPKPLKLAKGK